MIAALAASLSAISRGAPALRGGFGISFRYGAYTLPPLSLNGLRILLVLFLRAFIFFIYIITPKKGFVNRFRKRFFKTSAGAVFPRGAVSVQKHFVYSRFLLDYTFFR